MKILAMIVFGSMFLWSLLSWSQEIKTFAKKQVFKYGKGVSFVSDGQNYIYIPGMVAIPKQWKTSLKRIKMPVRFLDKKFFYVSTKTFNQKIRTLKKRGFKTDLKKKTFPVVYSKGQSTLGALTGRIQVYYGEMTGNIKGLLKNYGADKIKEFKGASYLVLIYSDKARVLSSLDMLSKEKRFPKKPNIQVLHHLRKLY